MCLAVAAFLIAPIPPAAAAQAPAREMVTLVETADELAMLSISPTDDGSIALAISSQAPRCRVPEPVFELPIEINGTGFQLKHATRPEQRREGDGGCLEVILTSYRPEHYWPLKSATSITLHLPAGPVTLNEAALAHVKRVTPARPAEDLDLKSGDYITVINRLTQMVQGGQSRQAREAAEVLLPAFATRPPDEGFAFFSLLGMARRVTGDLAFAASSYEVALRLAVGLDGTPNVGVVYDNLATVQRLQKRWSDAEQSSDRAIAALEAVDQPAARLALGGVLNNRALLLVDQERYDEALTYSERALALLKDALKDRPRQLEPFLDDNRRIREKTRRP